MGCSESKLDSLPAVSLCRERCKFLDHALRHLHALSKSHVAYTRSLHSTGSSLRLFFDRHLDNTSGPPPPTTTTTTTANAFTKTPTPAAVTTAAAAPLSTSSSSRSSDSHIKFDSDSDADDINPGRAPPEFHQIDYNYEDYYKSESFNVFFDKFTSINYMKRQPAPATTYTRQIHDNHYEVGRFFQPDDGPPPPPPPPAPIESAWDFSSFFEPYELQPLGSRRRDPERLQIQRTEERAVAGEALGEGKVAAGNGEDEVKKEEVKERYGGDNGRKVVREVEALFQKAAEAGDEVLKLINDDVSGVRYCRVNGVNPGASYSPFYSAVAKAEEETTPFIENNQKTRMKKKDSAVMEVDGDGNAVGSGTGEGNLSSIVKKLCIWEKKLLREVKTEEKLRVLYARKCQELKRLTERGADASKIDSVRATIGSLSTRLKVSLHVIDKISIRISKMSDEELCPMINDLIHRLFEMWKAMSECHRGQLRAVTGSKDLDRIKIASDNDPVGIDIEAFLRLKLEIHSLNLNFSNWVLAQAGCAGALNGWLTRCLGTEPEKLLDAPLVSVVCSRWARAVGSIKEKDVFGAMQKLCESLSEGIESQSFLYLQGKQSQDKDIERRIRGIEREEQRIHRAVQERQKILGFAVANNYDSALIRGQPVPHKAEIGKPLIPLSESLKGVFGSMERFSFESMEAYEELLSLIDARSDK